MLPVTCLILPKLKKNHPQYQLHLSMFNALSVFPLSRCSYEHNHGYNTWLAVIVKTNKTDGKKSHSLNSINRSQTDIVRSSVSPQVSNVSTSFLQHKDCM